MKVSGSYSKRGGRSLSGSDVSEISSAGISACSGWAGPLALRKILPATAVNPLNQAEILGAGFLGIENLLAEGAVSVRVVSVGLVSLGAVSAWLVSVGLVSIGEFGS